MEEINLNKIDEDKITRSGEPFQGEYNYIEKPNIYEDVEKQNIYEDVEKQNIYEDIKKQNIDSKIGEDNTYQNNIDYLFELMGIINKDKIDYKKYAEQFLSDIYATFEKDGVELSDEDVLELISVARDIATKKMKKEEPEKTFEQRREDLENLKKIIENGKSFESENERVEQRI